MRLLKRYLWEVGTTITGMLLLLVLMLWVSVSVAGAHEVTLGPATLGTITVLATPTEDATVAALNKEKLAQEVQQLKNQNEPDPLGWLRTNAPILLSTLVVVIGALIGFWQWRVGRRDAQDKELKDHEAERERRDEEQKRWLRDQESEREKRAEERFQFAVTGLGDEKEGARIGAAILLRTFLRPGYEQFYIQVFDLAVAHLRLRPSSFSSLEKDSKTPLSFTILSPEKDTHLSPTTLSQALIVAFKEAFPLARDRLKKQQGVQHTRLASQSLDATGIQLDNSYFVNADLNLVWMPQASLREANLGGANLIRVNLSGADLIRANLGGADLGEANLGGADLSRTALSRANLSGAYLIEANLSGAYLIEANLSGAYLIEANLSGVYLIEANLSWTNLIGANLSGAYLIEANLSRTNLSGADLSKADLSGANLSGANLTGASLKDTNLCGVKGLTKEQLETCRAEGAIIDEDFTAGLPQSAVSISSPSQSNDTLVQPDTPAAGVS